MLFIMLELTRWQPAWELACRMDVAEVFFCGD